MPPTANDETTEPTIAVITSSSLMKGGVDVDPLKEKNNTNDNDIDKTSLPVTDKKSQEGDECDPQDEEENKDAVTKGGVSKEELEGCSKIMEALADDEKEYMADDNMPLRHLRAENGDIEKATTKIKKTLAWRKEFSISALISSFTPPTTTTTPTTELLSFENATGKVYARGYDKENRAVLYLRPGVENSTDVDANLRHLVYNIERAIACTTRRSAGKEQKMNIVLDFYKFKLRKAPSLSTSKETLNILQNHYPERLHKAFICNPPFVFRTFWALVKPFIDPVTKSKIVFCHGVEGEEMLRECFDLEGMEECAGGAGERRVFDSKEYLEKIPFDHTFDESP